MTIIRAAECTNKEMLASSTWQETGYHVDVCCATSSAHIESC